jgi:hypothetical protein
MTEPTQTEFRAAQRRRSIATALVLVGFVALIFLVTVIKLQGHALNAPS